MTNPSAAYSEFPYEVDLSSYDLPELYETWIKEKPSMKRREISTLFQWDVKDGKVDDHAQGFNKYLLELFKSDLARGWSISERIDPFRLLPLEIQQWYTGLYHYNQTLLRDAYSDDERFPDLEYADFIREIYEDESKKSDWETAVPQCREPETQYAAEFLLWVLEDDGGFDSAEEYKNHCDQWKDLGPELFRDKLTDLMKENDLFKTEFTASWNPGYEKDETAFFDEIDFEFIRDFLCSEYNKWP